MRGRSPVPTTVKQGLKGRIIHRSSFIAHLSSEALAKEDRYLLPRCIGVTTLLLLVASTWLRGGIYAPWQPPLIILAGFLALGLYVYRSFTDEEVPRPRVLRDPILWLGLAFMLLLTLQWLNSQCHPYWNEQGNIVFPSAKWPGLPWSVDPHDALEMLVWFFPAWLIALALRNAMTPQAPRLLLYYVLCNVLLLALFGLIQVLTGADRMFWLIEIPNGGQFFSTFGYPNHAGAFFYLMYAVALGVLLSVLVRKSGGVEGWKIGRVEGWKSGAVESWKVGRLEGWKDGTLERERGLGTDSEDTSEQSDPPSNLPLFHPSNLLSFRSRMRPSFHPSLLPFFHPSPRPPKPWPRKITRHPACIAARSTAGRSSLIISLLLLLLTALAALFSVSRASSLAVVALTMLGVIIWLVYRGVGSTPTARVNLGLGLVVLGILGWVLFLGVRDGALQKEFSSVRTSFAEQLEKDIDGRTFQVPPALEMWRDSPWFGTGGWGYRWLVKLHLPNEDWKRLEGTGMANVHNDPLQFLCEFGLVGAALMAAMVGVLLVPWFRVFRRGGPLVWMSAAGLALVWLHSWVDLPFRCPAILWHWVALLCLVPAVVGERRNGKVEWGKIGIME